MDDVLAGLSERIRWSQDSNELRAALGFLAPRRPQVVLELGSYTGGSMAAWARIAAPDALLIAVDVDIARIEPFALLGQTAHLVEGKTLDPATKQEVERLLDGRYVEFLFIDGDHLLVREDYDTWRGLVRPSGGIIGFHDVEHKDVDQFATYAFWEHYRELPGSMTIHMQGSGMGIGFLPV